MKSNVYNNDTQKVGFMLSHMEDDKAGWEKQYIESKENTKAMDKHREKALLNHSDNHSSNHNTRKTLSESYNISVKEKNLSTVTMSTSNF